MVSNAADKSSDKRNVAEPNHYRQSDRSNRANEYVMCMWNEPGNRQTDVGLN